MVDDLKTKIEKLRARGDSIPEIARTLGLTQSQVNSAITKLNVSRIDMSNMNDKKKQKSMEVSTVRYADTSVPMNSETKLEKAKRILKGRIEERNGGYLLDGRPVTVWALLKFAGLTST